MASTPALDGERTSLRAWSEHDVDFVVGVASDPIIPLISPVPSRADRAGALAFIEAQLDRAASEAGWAWAVTPRDGAEAIGYIGALWTARNAGRASIGYWSASEHRRRGLMGDAVRAAGDWLLCGGGVDRLEAYIEPENVASIRTAEAADFEREGLMRSFAPIGGRRVDALLYARVAGRDRNSA